MDKVAASGLKPYVMEDGTISYEQARLVLVCKKLYADMIQEDKFVDKLLINRWYGEGHGNLHKMYILEIQHVLCEIIVYKQVVNNKNQLYEKFTHKAVLILEK